MSDMLPCEPHSSDIHELLGSHIVRMDDECAVILVQEAT